MVLCGKPEEAKEWRRYAKELGREDDLMIFHEESNFEFNPLQYEMTREGEGAGETMNLVNLFVNIFKMGQRLSGGDSQESERFWENSLRRLMNRMFDLLKLAGEEISVANLVEILTSAPEGDGLINKLADMKEDELSQWIEGSYCMMCIDTANGSASSKQEKRDFNLVYNYFLREFAKMPEKTRTTVSEMFLGIAEPFLSGILNDYFAQGLNIFPEQTFEGKIIIMDFPVKKYLDAGIYAQGIFKLLWQQSTERRDIKKYPTPVFLWVDESQLFISEYDQIFQTTARSSRACTVFLSQNISNYYAAIGGKDPRSRVDSLLGNLSIKIFHANNDYVTNQWAANTISKDFKDVESYNLGVAVEGNAFDSNRSYRTTTKQLHYQVEPIEFTLLKNGGESNDFKVEAVVTTTSKKFSNGKNFIRMSFNQTT